MTVELRIFFPTLKRQPKYSCKDDGSYYGYARYKEEIASDCQRRCVYCDVHEDEVGGTEAMQLDHFRPYSLSGFAHLENDPNNLHYGCGRCNRWKSDKWPALGTSGTHDGTDGFIDPFAEDRLKYFKVHTDGRIEPVNPPARYMIKLLHLEREFLRKVRQRRLLMAEVDRRVAALEAELEADASAGRKSDPNRVLEVLRLWKKVRATLG